MASLGADDACRETTFSGSSFHANPYTAVGLQPTQGHACFEEKLQRLYANVKERLGAHGRTHKRLLTIGAESSDGVSRLMNDLPKSFLVSNRAEIP